MKSRIFLLFIVSIVCCHTAFTQISVESDSISTKVYESFDIVAHNFFYNDIPQQKTIKWTRNIIQNTDPWEYAVCDDNQCYLPHISTEEIVLPPNSSSILDVHLYPREQYEGYSLVEMKMEYANDPNTNAFAYFIFDTNLSTTSTSSAPAFNFKIYPNPSKGLFSIDDEQKVVSSLRIVSLIGQDIMQINIGDRNWMDLGHLTNGNYMVLLLNDRGSIIGTKLITKI